ncbi:MAG: nicotinamide-nucleotide amidohydrolase family protein, partial [Lachnospiraceae bacterium]|nr:nicotinamide-nucleotide amidohydrolase family protein [Lachnospiraceae bacterium]
LIVENGKKAAILLPGPPGEMKPLFEQYVVAYFKKRNPFVISSVTVKLCGIGESKAEEEIKDLIENQDNPTIATYAKTGEVHLRITAKAESEKEAMKLIRPLVKKVKTRFGEKVFTTEDAVTLEQSLADLLLANNLTICTVESCTGGLVSARLINVPGVSEVYKFGHITYSNKAKRKIVGVKKNTLEKYTAVSEQVALQMVKGAGMFSKADVAIAVTGIAGPDGGTDEIPVGTVFIACDVKGNTCVQKYQFKGNRTKIRENAVAAALTLARKCVLEYITQISFGSKDVK